MEATLPRGCEGPPGAPKPELRLSTAARKAYEELARPDRRLFQRVDRAPDRLREEPQAGKPLQDPLRHHRSLRVGPLRVIFRFEADLLLGLALSIAERGQTYRDL